jgi:spermidine synthase
LIGTAKTFLFFSELLVLVAIGGLWISSGWRRSIRYAWMPVVLALLTVWLGGGPIKNTRGQIYETESAYNYIQVLEENGYRLLRLNEGQGIHSMWHPEIIDFDGSWKQFLAAPFFNPPDYAPQNVKNMAIIGLAAGTTVRQATAAFGPIPIDGYEIDPAIIRVGKEYFDMNESNLTPIAEDGRLGLADSDKRYSIIAVDAYRPPYIPWHLTTAEFFQEVYDHLYDDGVMVINVGRSPTDRRLIDGLVGTIKTVFPSVYVMDVPNTFNSVIYATVQPTSIDNLYQNLIYMYTHPGIHPLLINAVEQVVQHRQPVPLSQVVYTDDLAPIEWITNSMVLNYVLFGDMETLK